jgi:hypothetical protein
LTSAEARRVVADIDSATEAVAVAVVVAEFVPR